MRESHSRSAPRSRKVRILATLGPASNSRAMILKLAEAGADAFRVNMSHGTHKDHHKLIETVRSLEKELDRPTTILADLQGPKLRVGKFAGGEAELRKRPVLHLSTATRRRAIRPGSACPIARYSTRFTKARGC